MSPTAYSEDTLAQQTLADYLSEELGWMSVDAHNAEVLGVEGTLGRCSQHEVVLTRYLGEALIKLNPGLPDDAYKSAIRQITEIPAAQSSIQTNSEKYTLLRDGVKVKYKKEGKLTTRRLQVFDFKNPENNHFLCVRELWIQGAFHRRRPDLIGFVNGLPLLFVECKRPDLSLLRAYNDNIADYRDTIPQIFHFNAFLMLANGIEAKMGSLTAEFEHYSNWKRLAEGDVGVVQMETLVRGTCSKANFLDIFENFILFDNSTGKTAKIVARNHQYLGVNAAIEAVENRKVRRGKLGVFWHTQGAGKSYSMAFFAQKVQRKLRGNFTFLVLTDRQDLDKQIYKTFAGVGIADNDKDPCRAESGEALRALLRQDKAFIFSLIQKFNQEITRGKEYSTRKDIIVMTDEAHRTQYGTLAQNMRDALPNANFIGFTGTPLFKDDQITSRVFGSYVSTYDFQRAVEDNATLPLYYDARGDKLSIVAEADLNKKLAEVISEAASDYDPDVIAKLENDLSREYHIVTAPERLECIADDFVQHYATNWETGKAMYVAIDKITAVRMFNFISARWAAHADQLEKNHSTARDEQDLLMRKRQVAWMRETKIAVVVSDEQGEIARFKKWGLDILPHRKLMKDGFLLEDDSRVDVDTAFKQAEHPFRIVIVCAMWMTGFDVPALSTLYLDKPLQKHTLMQAIARANRVKEGKNNGLIVDYCGILKNLRQALATFAGHTGGGDGGTANPLHPEGELIAELAEAIKLVREQLLANGFNLEVLIKATGFAKNKALVDAKEAININDETRKHFEIAARVVFRKYKACLTFAAVRNYREEYEAISFIYKTLQKDKEQADISEIMQKLNAIVGAAIQVVKDPDSDDKIFDISKINFELLHKEFAKSKQQYSDIQALKEVIEQRLAKMLEENPLRTDFQEHYDAIIAAYNKEKDKNTIEATFEALMRFVAEMSEEERRYIAEGLENEQQLALFDMLNKPDLSKADIKKIKAVSVNLLNELQQYLEDVQDPFSKQATSDAFRGKINDYLYDDNTGLPVDIYAVGDLDQLTENIFQYFNRG